MSEVELTQQCETKKSIGSHNNNTNINSNTRKDNERTSIASEDDDTDPVYYVFHELQKNCAQGCHTFKQTWEEREASVLALAFQYFFLLLVAFRASIVSVIYVLYWQITLPMLLSRHRKTTIKSRAFRISQILLLSLATASLFTYIIYFSVVAVHPELDLGSNCNYFSQDGLKNDTADGHLFCMVALESVKAETGGAELILPLFDLIIVITSSVVVHYLLLYDSDDPNTERKLQRQTATLKVKRRTEFYSRSGVARLLLFVLLMGSGCTNITPLSFPIFLLLTIELIMWTMQCGSQCNEPTRSKHIFGSTNRTYWFLVSSYLIICKFLL
jgi:hypothetical protein